MVDPVRRVRTGQVEPPARIPDPVVDVRGVDPGWRQDDLRALVTLDLDPIRESELDLDVEIGVRLGGELGDRLHPVFAGGPHWNGLVGIVEIMVRVAIYL